MLHAGVAPYRTPGVAAAHQRSGLRALPRFKPTGKDQAVRPHCSIDPTWDLDPSFVGRTPGSPIPGRAALPMSAGPAKFYHQHLPFRRLDTVRSLMSARNSVCLFAGKYSSGAAGKGHPPPFGSIPELPLLCHSRNPRRGVSEVGPAISSARCRGVRLPYRFASILNRMPARGFISCRVFACRHRAPALCRPYVPSRRLPYRHFVPAGLLRLARPVQ